LALGWAVRTKRRTEVTIEVDEVVIRRAQAVTLAWCDHCGERVEMLTVDAAGAAARLSSRAIYREVEAGRVHFTELEDGSILVCASSLDALGVQSLVTSKPLRSAETSSLSPVIDIAADPNAVGS
jgi:hypothetical protein